MINNLINYFKDKKIVILGFGREGQSTYKLIRKYLKDQVLYIADQKEDFEKTNEILCEDKNVVCISGAKYLEGLKEYDVIMKAPGISFAGIDTTEFIKKIKSQLELLLQFMNVKTIGITGTKGKSTTSSLIYKILKDQNVETMFLGNIGIPVFDFIDQIKEDMVVVLEMSSHQLEYMNLSPNISILLNIFEEHLDHYNSYMDYAEAKCKIFRNQKESDYFLYNIDNEMVSKLCYGIKGKSYKVSIEGNENANIKLVGEDVLFNGEKVYDKNESRNLLGEYNLNNIMFALGVVKILNLDVKQAIKSIADFKTLNHRLELVGTFDGVSYYDNSIGTIPKATIEAVKALKDVNTLIIGGMDRGIDFTEFITFLNNSDIENIICMPKTGHDIAKELPDDRKYIVETLEEAVSVAKKITKKNKICLLSPTSASYGFFKNFEEKGDRFKELVKQ